MPPSELIINEDETIFHLHLRPEQLADTVILVGDPARVDMVTSFFEHIELRVENREFRTVTGSYLGKRMTVIATGIGIGNIDICLTELDALANIDFKTRMVKSEFRALTLLRLGTSGGLQPDIRVGDAIFARTSIGFDGVLSFYKGSESVLDLDMERAFVEHMKWSERLAAPYCVDADAQLWELFKDVTREGITIASPGFYASQGRNVRLEIADSDMLSKIESFNHQGRCVTNFEMESSLLAGLARLMGHRAATICTIIAQRVAQKVNTDYKPYVESMVKMALDKLVELK